MLAAHSALLEAIEEGKAEAALPALEQIIGLDHERALILL